MRSNRAGRTSEIKPLRMTICKGFFYASVSSAQERSILSHALRRIQGGAPSPAKGCGPYPDVGEPDPSGSTPCRPRYIRPQPRRRLASPPFIRSPGHRVWRRPPAAERVCFSLDFFSGKAHILRQGRSSWACNALVSLSKRTSCKRLIFTMIPICCLLDNDTVPANRRVLSHGRRSV